MSKNFRNYLIIWLIMVVASNAIIFILPDKFEVKYSDVFWIAYALVMVAFAVQLICMCVWASQSTLERKFLNLPIVTFSYRMLIVSGTIATTLLAGPDIPEWCSVLFKIPKLPYWIAAIVAIITVAFYVIAIISANTAANAIEAVGKKTAEATSRMKSFVLSTETLKNSIADVSTKKKVQEIYEALKYSDPVSSSLLYEEEDRIAFCIELLKEAVRNADEAKIDETIEKTKTAIQNRNAKCKALKQ